jgi:hypothetical protein
VRTTADAAVGARAADSKKTSRRLELLAGAGDGAEAKPADNGAGVVASAKPADSDEVVVGGGGGGGRTRTKIVRHAYVNDAAVDSFLSDFADVNSFAANAPAPAAPAGVGRKTATLRRKYVNVFEGDEDSNA